MTTVLELDRAKRRQETHKMRVSFMPRLKQILKELEEPQFLALCREALHRSHYPALHDYVFYSDLAVSSLATKQEKARAVYMVKMFRKTLTCVLTDTSSPEGYSSFILEWLILNKLWKFI